MKIEKFQKLKNGQYQLTLEDGKVISCYEDVILKYELLRTQGVDASLLEQLQQENQFYDVYFVALCYLRLKLRSKSETIIYLQKKAYPIELIERAVVKLEQQGYINDSFYADAFVHEQLALTSNGPEKIRQALRRQKVPEEVIEEKLGEYTTAIEEEKIAKVIFKMQKSNHNKSTAFLKRKIMDYLVQQGFHRNVITPLLEDATFSEDAVILKREYDKLYRKLSKKYSGSTLEYQIKQKLYQKGFSYEEYKTID